MQKNHLLVLVASLAAGACGSSQPSGATEPATGDTFAAQVERGAALYGASCAGCHGADGSGSANAPAIVGTAALPLDPPAGAKHRTVQFRTALDVFRWVKKTMPANSPGSLTDAQYVDILAFDLKANGVELDRPLDAEVATGLELR